MVLVPFILIVFLLCEVEGIVDSLVDGKRIISGDTLHPGISQCKWARSESKDKAIELFWINMDKSVDRRKSLETHLASVGILNRRVRALTLDDIYFPNDVLSNWDKIESKLETSEPILFRNETIHNQTHVMIGLTGRGGKNKLKEIGCTSSHLEAMRQAVYENRTQSRYAVITEDDIQIPFNIDFNKLVEVAPAGFGILQLFNSNEESMESLWKRYAKRGDLWTETFHKQPASFWSTCAYLIDREVLRPVLERIIYARDGWIQMQIIAGIKQPCRPKFTACCILQNDSMSFRFLDEPPCIWARKGFQADSFIYSIAKTFVLNVPLITNGAGGNQSTFHQDHVENIHDSAFTRQRSYINEMIAGKVPLPAFASLACTEPLPLSMTLHKRPPCQYRNTSLDDSAAALYFVNMEEHVRQRENLEGYLSSTVGMRHLRVAGVAEDDVYIPPDVLGTWESKECLYDSEELRSAPSMDPLGKVIARSGWIGSQGLKFLVSGLCGRGKGHNTLKDMRVTLSHLKAIYIAVHRNVTSSPYAWIAEDDAVLPFDMDVDALAAALPADWAMLRLVDGFETVLEKHWIRFRNNHSDWVSASQTDKFYDGLATKAYLVHRSRMLAVLSTLLRWVPNDQSVDLLEVKLLAGLRSPCLPAQCCMGGQFNGSLPCVDSRFGFQSERFLFRLAPTYLTNFPLATGGLHGIHTQLKDDKPEPSQLSAIRRQKLYINDFIEQKQPLPGFARVGCNKLVV